MKRNTAGQKLDVFAYNRITNAPVTGDAANITAAQSSDREPWQPLNDLHPDEDDAILAAGHYTFNLLKAETDGGIIKRSAKSTTPNVIVLCLPIVVETTEQHCATGCGGLTALQLQQINTNLQTLIEGTCPPRR